MEINCTYFKVIYYNSRNNIDYCFHEEKTTGRFLGYFSICIFINKVADFKSKRLFFNKWLIININISITVVSYLKMQCCTSWVLKTFLAVILCFAFSTDSHFYFPVLAYQIKAVVLSSGWFCILGNIWQCVAIFFVVTTGALLFTTNE